MSHNTTDPSESPPLLQQEPRDQENDAAWDSQDGMHQSKTRRRFQRYRETGRRVLDSRRKHFIIMAVVALDVVALLANVFIQLIACELGRQDEEWVEQVSEVLEIIGLVCSSLFLLELLACLVSFGFSFLASWFHLFDATVIVLSFIIDIASRGLTESIASLIVILRLWRLAKISEEFFLGASERMEILQQQMEDLESENKDLRSQLGLEAHRYHDHDPEAA